MREEKILLLQLILEDIRGNWGWNLEERVDMAFDLASELGLEQHIRYIDIYKELCSEGDDDGRFFRTAYEYGGYVGMEELHGLEPTIQDKSNWFKNQVFILTYPRYRLDDWDRYEAGR